MGTAHCYSFYQKKIRGTLCKIEFFFSLAKICPTACVKV